eukprot:9455503-Lingulodinium_polyedra.AAC.1
MQKNSAKDPSEATVFKEVFGTNKNVVGNLEKANEAMEKFLELYPDGKCPPGKPRGKDFQMNSLVHVEGHKKESYIGEEGKLWDLE